MDIIGILLCYSGIKMQAQAHIPEDRRPEAGGENGIDVSSAFWGLMGALVAIMVFVGYGNRIFGVIPFYIFASACALSALVGVVLSVLHRQWVQLLVTMLAVLFCGAVLMGPYFLNFLAFSVYTSF